MIDILSEINVLFWSSKFWLPKNLTWQDIEKYNQFDIENFIINPFYMTILLFTIKRFFEKYFIYNFKYCIFFYKQQYSCLKNLRFIAWPIGKLLRIKDDSKIRLNFQSNIILELYYLNYSKDNDDISESIYSV